MVYGSEPDSMQMLFHRVAEWHLSHANRFFKQFNMTFEQAVVMFAASTYNGISQKTLAELTYKDQANITRIIKRLVAKKFLEIRGLPSDKRVNLVYVTAHGREFLDKLNKIKSEMEECYKSLYDQKLLEKTRLVLNEYLQMLVNANEQATEVVNGLIEKYK